MIFLDGPMRGVPARVPESAVERTGYVCTSRNDGPFYQYTYSSDGLRYQGPCTHDHPKMCNKSWDTGHSCTQIGDHSAHQCCCGETHS